MTASSPPGAPLSRAEQAVQILEMTRAQIQAELTGETAGHPPSKWDLLGLLGGGKARRGLWRLVRHRLRAGRAGRTVIDVIERWWAQHPLRLPLSLAGHALEQHLPAVVRRHPAVSLAAGVAGGFALMHWRHHWWPPLHRGMRRLPRRLLSLLWIELAHPQVQASLLQALMAGADDPADEPVDPAVDPTAADPAHAEPVSPAPV